MKRILSLFIAAVILAFASVPVFAATDSNPSPSASKEYKVDVKNTNGGAASYTTGTGKDGRYTDIKAKPKNGYKFSYWTIKGEYEIIKGSLKSEFIRILPKSDIVATPHFVKEGTSSTSSGSKISVSQNSSPTSPQTGDNAIYFIFGTLAVLLAVSVAVGVKVACSNKK